MKIEKNGITCLTDEDLMAFEKQVSNELPRWYVHHILEYIRDPDSGCKHNTSMRVMSLIGLRRTGKTHSMFHALSRLTKEEHDKAAYINCVKGDNIDSLYNLIGELFDKGYNIFFIDEITSLHSFPGEAQHLADIEAGIGRVIITGTFSLEFTYAAMEALFDRQCKVYTSYIPFAEWSQLMRCNDIDEYIRFGGLLSKDGFNYNAILQRFLNGDKIEEIPANLGDTDIIGYLDISVVKNISKTVTSMIDAGEPYGMQRRLVGSITLDKVQNAVVRCVLDETHRFVTSVARGDFHISELEKTLIKFGIRESTDIFNNVISALRYYSEIRDFFMYREDLSETDLMNISGVFQTLNLTGKIVRNQLRIGDTCDMLSDDATTAILVPCIRYGFTTELVKALGVTPDFERMSLDCREAILKELHNQVSGKILEEIILVNTAILRGESSSVYSLGIVDAKYRIDLGEFDMVICDEEKQLQLYEIKHSAERNDEQCKNLRNDRFLDALAECGYTVVSRNVIYLGEDCKTQDGIQYLNVIKYLNNLYDDNGAPKDSLPTLHF